MDPNGKALTGFLPEHTLDYFVKKRNGRKRDYIFNYGQALKCDHPNMRIMVRGGNKYRCPDCNYTFTILGAHVEPLHFQPIWAMFNLMYFVKEFGYDALMEVLRTPIGQTDGTPHKPVLPDGMSFMDVMAEMEAIDTTAEDGGVGQLRSLLDAKWAQNGKNALEEGERDHDQASAEDGDQTSV